VLVARMRPGSGPAGAPDNNRSSVMTHLHGWRGRREERLGGGLRVEGRYFRPIQVSPVPAY